MEKFIILANARSGTHYFESIITQHPDIHCFHEIFSSLEPNNFFHYLLQTMNKKATVEQAKAAVRNTRKAGIFPNTTFIFGYPGETRETVQETIEFKRDLGIECGSFYATPYPETPLYKKVNGRIAHEESYINSLGNANEFTINLTDFDDNTLFALKNAMDENRDVI